MDGYCDTQDALASRQSKERCLEILKDPHVGAFALIRYAAYLLVSFGLLHELFVCDSIAGIGWLYVVSRSLTAGSALRLPNARKNGMLAAFTEQADHRAVGGILTVLTLLSAAGFGFFSAKRGIAGVVFSVPVTLWYCRMVMKRFGGVTGDTTGYYLQVIEQCLLVGLLVGGYILQWL
jgi:adenosylcobinamide-GDP ribazoletransferase